LALEQYFLLIAVVSVIASALAISVPFILRSLGKGEKMASTTTNVYNLSKDYSDLEKREYDHHKEVMGVIKEINDRRDRDWEKLNDTFAQIGGDIKLHTNQLSSLCKDQTDQEIRLRTAEQNIVRLDRNGVRSA
jgi:hypothetical protein